MRILPILAVLASPAMAETPLDGDAFEALVTGKTLTFSTATGPYGIEYYAPDRRVIWSIIGGDCKNGIWYEEQAAEGPNICFEYEDDSEPQCWRLFDEGGKIRAEFANTPGGSILYEAAESEPLICGGVGT